MPRPYSRARRFALAASSVIALVVGLVAAPALAPALPVPAANADGTPDIQVARSVAAQTLYGKTVSVTLTATSPGAPDAFNLTFSDMLPAGASVATSPQYPVSRTIPQLDGTTLVIWENVADLLEGTSVGLTYTFDYPRGGDPGAYQVGAEFTGTARAYVGTNPFLVPNPLDEPEDGSVWEDYTGFDEATSTTRLVPYTVSKRVLGLRESELLRGIHDNKAVWEITVTNNTVNPSTNPVIVDYLPAALEFLGCTPQDNSSGGPEYPGAPGLDAPGGFPSVSGCDDSSYTAATVQTDPDGPSGPLPSAVYTKITWDQLLDLGPSDVITLRYAAGIPLHANEFDPAVTNPVANLDNNTGPEADDEQPIVNYVTAQAVYLGDTYDVGATATVHAEDVLVWKSVDRDDINQDQITTWTLDIATSEYTRSTGDIVVTDTIPDGLDWDGPTTGLSRGPTENPDGTLTVEWTLPSLGSQDTAQITYTTKTRKSYRAVTDMPVSANDSWTNRVHLVTDTSLLSGADGSETRDVSDVIDDSSASQTAESVRIDKLIAPPVSGGCSAVPVWYQQAPDVVHPGDRVCYRIDVDFPLLLNTQRAYISDYLPPGFSIVGDPDYVSPHDLGDSNDLSYQPNPKGTVLTWTKDTVNIGRHFSAVITAELATTASAQKADIVANLLKVRTQNSAGAAFQLRDQATAEVSAPLLELEKELVSPASGTVEAGDHVTYKITVTNTGEQDAVQTEVRDVLPPGWACTEVISTTPVMASCTDDVVAWTGLTVPASGSLELEVVATTPETAAPGDSYENRAGVRSYQGESNTGAHTYYPKNNVDAGITPGNTDRADDTATVAVTGGTITKAAATSLSESGNNASTQATIGEGVTFTITATIPSGTTLYGSPAVTDAVDARYEIVGATFTLDTDGPSGAAPGAPVAATVTGSTVSVPLGPLDTDGDATTYLNPTGSGADIVVLTIQARIRDEATVKRSNTIPNQATLSWQNSTGTPRSASASAPITVVEPNIAVAKTANRSTATPDDTITYTLTIRNTTATNVSTAHDIDVVDTVPLHLIPLTTGGDDANDGDPVLGTGGGVWHSATRTITFPSIPSIAPGGAATVYTYQAKVEEPLLTPGSVINSVTATATSLPGVESGERTAASPVTAGYTSTKTLELNAPVLGMTKSASPGTRTIGELVTYTLKVTIPAGTYANSVLIRDTLPPGVRYHGTPAIAVDCDQSGPCSPAQSATLIGSPSASDTDLGFWLGDLEPATAQRVVTITYTGVVTTTAATGSQTNTARLYSHPTDSGMGTPPTLPDLSGYTMITSATAAITVQRPLLGIVKKVNGADSIRAEPGQVLHYSLVVTNSGTSPAYDVTVTDTPNPNLTGYTPVTMTGVTPVDTDPSAGPLRWTIAGPIAVGASVTLEYDLTAPASWTEVNEIAAGYELSNVAVVPSYFGVPSGSRTLGSSYYIDYVDAPDDRADVELDLASLGDRVWFDVNGDGVQDAGEPGIPGVTVTVLYAGANGTFGNGDDESRTLTTDANGYYLAEHLPGGQYRVSITTGDLPAGLTPSHDRNGIATPHVWTGALAQNGAPRDIDFGYTGTGSIGDRVWYDQDADGVQDAGEPGIAGRTVTVVWAGLDGVLGGADDIDYTTTTDANGVYSVALLPAGSFTVTVSGMPDGYASTKDPDLVADGTAITSLTAGQNRTDQDFGYAGSGSIGHLVWIDRDGDGAYDPTGPSAEQGVAGATVALDWYGVTGGVGDPVVATFVTTTDTLGEYLFANLVPGTYTVRVAGGLPSASTNTHDRDGNKDSKTDVALALAGVVTNADFGYSSDSSLGERVWWDRDGDGVQDADEPGFPGVGITVRYFGPNDTEGDGDDRLFTTATDATGYWSLPELPEGEYRVTVDSADLPAGFSPTFDADGIGTAHTSTTSLGSGSVRTQNFGYRGAYSIGDLVFLDRDADGVQDAGEPGLAGVTLVLTWDSFTLGAVTDASGLYSFEGLPAGTFAVTMLTASLPSASLVPVSDLEGAPDDATATLTLAADRTDADFGVRGDASLGDLVWHDRDADGVLDADESGIAGVTVTAAWAGRDAVSGTSDDLAISTTTDANGAYAFDHLPVGEWTVEADLSSLPSGFADPTFEEDGVLDASVVATLAAGDVHDTADFGYRGAGTIGDRVWLDLDGDGVQDAGEPGIAGQEVRVEWAGRDGAFDGVGDETWTTTTGADGAWIVTGLPDGAFRVTVVGGITTRATQTGDPDATLDDQTAVTLSPADRLEDAADFGYRGEYAVGDTVWWDESEDGVVDAGELRLAGVDVEVAWAGLDDTLGTSDDIVRATTTDASGQYLVEVLPEGSYRVQVSAGVPAGLGPIADPDGVGAPADGASEFALPGSTVGTQDLTRDFGYAGTGSIGDRVWLDLTGDGVDDAGEPGIPGVALQLTWFGTDGTEGTADDVTWTKTTDASGAYRFDGLPAGGFRVALTGLPAGVAPTADPDGTGTPDTGVLTLAAGATDLDQDFGYAGTASVGDTVWLDLDDDGAQGLLEPGLPGILVTVRLAGADDTLGTSDDIVHTRTTDGSGVYLATGLPAGSVEVSYDPSALDPGYLPSFDRDGGDEFSSTLILHAADAIDDVDFAIVGDAQLRGVVFDDRNGNGKRDTTEAGVPGIDVVVEWDGGPLGRIPIVVTTDALGEWSLLALPPGAYVSEIVKATIPAGYRVVTERSVTRVLVVGGSEFVIMGITNRPLAFTGYDPRTNMLIGLGALLLGIGGLTVARVRVGRREQT